MGSIVVNCGRPTPKAVEVVFTAEAEGRYVKFPDESTSATAARITQPQRLLGFNLLLLFVKLYLYVYSTESLVGFDTVTDNGVA